MQLIELLLIISMTGACGSALAPSHQDRRPQAKATNEITAQRQVIDGTADQETADTGSVSGVQTEKTLQKPIEFYSVGPYRVGSSGESLEDPGYAAAEIFYPTNTGRMNLPVVTISGGFSNFKEDVTFIARHLASYGIISVTFTPVDNLSLDPNMWAQGHRAALEKVLSETTRKGSPLFQKAIDRSRLANLGFSLGGAGAILAALSSPRSIKATVALCPFLPETPSPDVATLLLTGDADIVADSSYVAEAYSLADAKTPKAFVKVSGLGHTDVLQDGVFRPTLTYYLTAWLQLFLHDDPPLTKVFDRGGYAADAVPPSIIGKALLEFKTD